MKSGFLIDYLTFTVKGLTVFEVKKLLNLHEYPWEESTSKWFYKDGEYFSNIKILYNPKNDRDFGNITVEMTGQGCRNYEHFGRNDWDFLFLKHKQNEINISRVDIAFDDKDRLIDITKLAHLTTKEKNGKLFYLSSEFKSHQVQRSIPASNGTTIYWGSKKSECFYRVYDKAKQMGDLKSHWIRFELQLRKDTAEYFLKTAYSDDYAGDWKRLYMEFLRKKIRFVYRKKGVNDMSLSRLPTAPFWNDFLKNADKAKPFDRLPKVYGYDNLRDYVVNQTGQALLTLAEIDGASSIFHDVKKNRQGKDLAPKYQALVSEMKASRLSR